MIHPTAIVSADAKVGANVSVGPYSIVHGNVRIGDGCVIGSHCEIGHPTPLAEGKPLIFGAGATIRSHSVFYEGSIFGDGLVTGHRVTVRDSVRAGRGLQIGTLGDIQGDCTIGDYVRLHSNVHIGRGATVGNFVWMFPYVVLTNDPHPPSEIMRGVTIGDFAAIATMSVILPGVAVGEGALVAAHSSVRKDVEPGDVVAGVPAQVICRAESILLKDGSGRPAYPWRRHFHRGYPDEIVARWLAEFGAGDMAVGGSA